MKAVFQLVIYLIILEWIFAEDTNLCKNERVISNYKKIVNEMSMDEFEDVLHDCGIESMKPSIESSYVKCLKRNISEREY